MKPVLFHIGQFPVHSYGVAIMVAFLAGVALARARAIKAGIDVGKVLDISIWTLMAGILGARVTYIVQDLDYYLKHTDELFSPQFQGLTSFGGLIFGIPVFIWLTKRSGINVRTMLDVAAPSFLVGHAIGRIGCLLNGCCHGGVCDLPWGVPLANRVGLYHPAQVYDSLLNLGALALLLVMERRWTAAGKTFAMMLVLHGLTRFAYEFWRAGSSSTYWGSLPVTEAQVAALVVSLIGGILFWRFGRAVETAPEPS